MSASLPTPRDPRQAALEYVWGQYRVWAATSGKYRNELSAWRFWVLMLGIAGAIVGTLSGQSSLPLLKQWTQGPTVLGVLSAALLGLAVFFTKEILSPEREGRWVRSRAAAESYKRESYLMAAKAPPYDGAITSGSLDQAKKINDSVSDLLEVRVGDEEKRRRLPPCPMTVEDYIGARLNEQMNDYYRKKTDEYESKIKRIRLITLVLGAVAVILGALGGGVTAAWVAVITTITASLAAYLYSERYQYLIVSYAATARNLDSLRAVWMTSGKTEADTAERNQLILDCENALAAENKAWMAEWTKSDPPPTGNSGGGAQPQP
jgi:membrane protein implicated in regulation of membrane protease activity